MQMLTVTVVDACYVDPYLCAIPEISQYLECRLEGDDARACRKYARQLILDDLDFVNGLGMRCRLKPIGPVSGGGPGNGGGGGGKPTPTGPTSYPVVLSLDAGPNAQVDRCGQIQFNNTKDWRRFAILPQMRFFTEQQGAGGAGGSGGSGASDDTTTADSKEFKVKLRGTFTGGGSSYDGKYFDVDMVRRTSKAVQCVSAGDPNIDPFPPVTVVASGSPGGSSSSSGSGSSSGSSSGSGGSQCSGSYSVYDEGTFVLLSNARSLVQQMHG